MEEFFTKSLSLGALLISALIISYLLALAFKSSDFYSNFLKKFGLQVVFVFSLVATVGSLLMSIYFDFPPCDLCWYQRMFMYPIVFISGVAIFRKDFKGGSINTIIMAVIGSLIAIYHYVLQFSDSLSSNSAFCSPTSIDCSIPDFVHFGFVTTPFISLVAFILIIISAFYAQRKS